MRRRFALIARALIAFAGPALAEDHHDHPVPEKLGTVVFATSCQPGVAQAFNRATALLHSFAYTAAWEAYHQVAAADRNCAMAWWGMAMTHYHQLWDPPGAADIAQGRAEIERAASMAASPRERGFIGALQAYYQGEGPPQARAQRYAAGAERLARAWPRDDEAQVFYALSLVATASPGDRTHAAQKRAAAILEPIWRRRPLHPGVPHYLIHAYDSAELAHSGLPAARAYAGIAPAAPHALHMPSHIFTRLGLWDDSIASNRAAMAAARAQHDVGEQLHAMDYLVYALIQKGRFDEAADLARQARAMNDLPVAAFKVGYAANAMSVRLAVERSDWRAAADLEPLAGSPSAVEAMVYWARALGRSRASPPAPSDDDIAALEARAARLRAAGEAYWAVQADVMAMEARAWRLAAQGQTEPAVLGLRAAANEEDQVEKLPVTPGPIVPAREQLGELLLASHRPTEALTEFNAALAQAPGRRGALLGAAEAASVKPRP